MKSHRSASRLGISVLGISMIGMSAVGIVAACALTSTAGETATAETATNAASYDFDSHPLAAFNLDTLTLANDVAKMKRVFPTAQPASDSFDESLGRQRFVVTDPKTGQELRFFFCDDKLYQIEVRYQADRLRKGGGILAMVRKLVASWGYVNHAGESRWTWQQPNVGRRADLLGTVDGAMLVVTDLNLIPIIENRTQRLETAAEGNVRVD